MTNFLTFQNCALTLLLSALLSLTAFAQEPIDTATIQPAADYYEWIDGQSSLMINVADILANDLCITDDPVVCKDLLKGLYVTEIGQPDFGKAVWDVDLIFYYPNSEFFDNGYDKINYTISNANGIKGEHLTGVIYIYKKGIDPVILPCLTFTPFCTYPNLICNPGICSNIPNYLNICTGSPVNCWSGTHGTPNGVAANWPYAGGIDAGYVSMWALANAGGGTSHGEGLKTNVTINPNSMYLFAYNRATPASNTLNNAIVSLHSSVATCVGTAYDPATSTPNQNILTETNLTTNTTMQTAFTCFTTGSQGYSELAIYPRQNSGSAQSILSVDRVDLVELPLPLSYAYTALCNQQTVLQGPNICLPPGFGWQWYLNNTLITGATSATYIAAHNSNGTYNYSIQLTYPTSGINYGGCKKYGLDYMLTVDGCPCDNNLWFNGTFETSANAVASGMPVAQYTPSYFEPIQPNFWPVLFPNPQIPDHTTGTISGHFFWQDHVRNNCNFTCMPPTSGGVDLVILQQNINTVASGTYTFSAWVWPPACQTAGKISLEVNGTTYLTHNFATDPNCVPQQWQQISTTITGTGLPMTFALIADDEIYMGYDFAIDDIEVCGPSCSESNFVANLSAQTFGYAISPGTLNATFTVPAGVLPTDLVEWDINCDNSIESTLNPSYTHTFAASGTYVVCLTVKRVSGSDTCEVTLTKKVTIPLTCNEFTTQMQNAPLPVDMSLLPTVTFYPPFGLLTSDVVIWDTNCDGVPEFTGNGSTPFVASGLPCGPQTICVRIIRTFVYQTGLNGEILDVDCEVKLEKQIVIPCDKPCCADFMTDFNNYGIVVTHLGGINYQFCVSGSLTTGDIVNWDINCDSTPDTPNSQAGNCFTFTFATPGNYTACAEVIRPNSDGTVCKIKLNTCFDVVDTPEPCLCDKLQTNVSSGFIYNTTLDSFTPVALLPCDVVTWTWGDNSPNTTSIGNNTVYHTYSTSGSYYVCMMVQRTDDQGLVCYAEKCDLISGFASPPNQLPTNVQPQVAPNPTENYITITFSDIAPAVHTVNLTTPDGKIVTTKTIMNGMLTQSLDLGALPQGLYVLYFYNQQGVLVANPQKIVKI